MKFKAAMKKIPPTKPMATAAQMVSKLTPAMATRIRAKAGKMVAK